MNYIFTSAEISADILFPMEIYFCLLYSEDNEGTPYSIMPQHPFQSGWGIGSGKQISFSEIKPFSSIEVAWLSLTEGVFYYGQFNINKEIVYLSNEAETNCFSNLIIGLAPKGKIALWANNEYCSKLVDTYEAKEIDIPITEFLEYDYKGSVHKYCKKVLEESCNVMGICDEFDFDKRMRQYCYRFSITTRMEDIIQIEKICAFYTDGTYNRNNYGSINFRAASIPEKLNIRFKSGKGSYLLSLFFTRVTMYDAVS